MSGGQGFELIHDEPERGANVVTHPAAAERESAREPRGQKFATDALILALTALSKRALVALASLFTLITVGSAWWLWWATAQLDAFELIKLGMYAVFVLAINWMVHRSP